MDPTGGLRTFDHDTVERFTRDWEQMFDRGDARAMAAFYAEDARLIATQTATVEGRAAIEKFWQASCDAARAATVKRVVKMEHMESAEGLGYVRGTVVLTVRDAPRVVRYVTVWRRDADGAWRCIVDISSAAP